VTGEDEKALSHNLNMMSLKTACYFFFVGALCNCTASATDVAYWSEYRPGTQGLAEDHVQMNPEATDGNLPLDGPLTDVESGKECATSLRSPFTVNLPRPHGNRLFREKS
jgi:hypothetical protein